MTLNYFFHFYKKLWSGHGEKKQMSKNIFKLYLGRLIFIDTKSGDKLPAKVISRSRSYMTFFSVEETTKDRDTRPSDSER